MSISTKRGGYFADIYKIGTATGIAARYCRNSNQHPSRISRYFKPCHSPRHLIHAAPNNDIFLCQLVPSDLSSQTQTPLA